MVVSVDQVEVVWEEEVRLETVEGAVVSIKAEPLLEYAELLETASVANALKYQVPSAKATECVYELVVEVAVLEAQPVKAESVHHCTEYGVVPCKPAPVSVEAVKLQVGVLSAVGVMVEGVPGTEGAVVST